MLATFTWFYPSLPREVAGEAESQHCRGVHLQQVRPTVLAVLTASPRFRLLAPPGEAHHLQRRTAHESVHHSAPKHAADLLRCGDVHPNPGPSLSVGQWNACGLTPDKRAYINSVLHDHSIDVMLLIELKLCAEDARSLQFPGYKTHAGARSSQGGGVAILVRDDLQSVGSEAIVLNGFETVNMVVTHLKESIQFTCSYWPAGKIFHEQLEMTTARRTPLIWAGDTNAHHPAWDGFVAPTSSGDTLHEWLMQKSFTIANNPAVATRHRETVERTFRSAPDVTAFSTGAEVLDWQTETTPTASDHELITYKVLFGERQTDVPTGTRPSHAHYSWRKADWSKFKRLTRTFLTLTKPSRRETVSAEARRFAACVAAATKYSVPRGGMINARPPSSSHEVLEAVERETIDATIKFRELPDDADIAVRHALFEKLRSAQARRRELYETTAAADYRKRCDNLDVAERASWKFLNSIGRPPSARQATLLDANGRPMTAIQQARALRDMYARVSKAPKNAPPKPKIGGMGKEAPITLVELRQAINETDCGKAAGADGVYPEALRHLPRHALRQLLSLYCRSLCKGEVPEDWRRADIVPLLKGGKPVHELASYRPVSLTAVLSKTMERIICRRILRHLEGRLTDNQSGFRSGRRTQDQVLSAVAHGMEAMRRKQPRDGRRCSAALMVDLSRAFDRVEHNTLLARLQKMGVSPDLCRWVRSFLTGRKGRVVLSSNKKTGYTAFTAGVPQGTVLGPLLFAAFVDDLSKSLSEFSHGFYADDLTVYASGTAEEVQSKLQKALDVIEDWTKRNFMEVSPTKTVCLAFGRLPAALHLTLGDKVIEQVNSTRLLGVTIDSKLTLQDHVNNVSATAKQRISQLRHICSASWGPRSCDLRTFYLGHVVATVVHDIGAWFGCLTNSRRETLEKLHRAGARVVTGLPQPTKCESLLLEARLVPIEDIALRRAAVYFEEIARLPPDSIRRRDAAMLLADLDHPVNKLREELAELGLPVDHPVDELQFPQKMPHEYDITRRVVIRPTSLPGVRKADCTPDELLRANRIALARGRRPTVECYVDGSVHLEERSGAAAVFIRRRRTRERVARVIRRAAGRWACSFRAETIAMTAAFEHMLEAKIAGQCICVATDSQSLLLALKAGPLAHTEGMLVRLWDLITQVAARNWVRLIHVFSHCGLFGNDEADKEAEKASELPQENVPIWTTDYAALVGRTIRCSRSSKMPTDTHRANIADMKPTPKDELRLPRHVSTTMARLRVGWHPDVGRLPRCIDPHLQKECRWCHRLDATELRRADDIRKNYHQRRSYAPTPCPVEGCKSIFTKRDSGVYHIVHVHGKSSEIARSLLGIKPRGGAAPRTARPRPERNACEYCNVVYPDREALRKHQELCSSRDATIQCPSCAAIFPHPDHLQLHLEECTPHLRRHRRRLEREGSPEPAAPRPKQNRKTARPVDGLPAADDQERFRCVQCGQVCRSQGGLKLHQRKKHPVADRFADSVERMLLGDDEPRESPAPLPCPHNRKAPRRGDDPDQNEGQRGYRCEHCGQVCKSRGGLSLHITKKHPRADNAAPIPPDANPQPQPLHVPEEVVDEETVSHVLFECPALASLRMKHGLGRDRRADMHDRRIVDFIDEAIAMLRHPVASTAARDAPPAGDPKDDTRQHLPTLARSGKRSREVPDETNTAMQGDDAASGLGPTSG